MNWTVLGSSGTVGRCLVATLQERGEKPYTPGRLVKDLYKQPMGHVIYAIGLTADFRQRPYDTVEAHVCLLANLLQHCDFESLLYLSSTRVYARATSSFEDAVLPVLAQDPSDLYNLSKLMGEALCFRDARACVRVARLSNVVGGDRADSANFVPSLLREAKDGRIVLQSALDSAKDYIHTDDVVELLLNIAERGRMRLYNVASGVQTTNRQWTDQLARQTGCSVEVEPGAPTSCFAPIDISRITAEFNFLPRPVLASLASLL